MSWQQLPKTEKANVLTHALGIFLFIILGMVFFIRKNHDLTNVLTGSMFVFFCSATWLYLTSTIYHYSLDAGRKLFWRNMDHIAIFFLIGGTYQPFIMLYYPGEKGMIFMMIMWVLIFMGVGYKIFIRNSWGWFSTLIYLGLGWMVVFIIKPLIYAIGNESLYWLFLGGLAYTIGVIFYQSKKIPYNHAIWHLFVLAGTISHYISILKGINSL